jgi:hypothetical protein
MLGKLAAFNSSEWLICGPVKRAKEEKEATAAKTFFIFRILPKMLARL